jgi:hypothetical protein
MPIKQMAEEPFTTFLQLISKSNITIDYQLQLEAHGFGTEFAMILT